MKLTKIDQKKKLTPKYIGPYEIIDKISSTVYKLKLPNNLHIHPVFHISLIKLYHEITDDFNRELPPQPDINVDNNQSTDEYEVEKILDIKYKRGKLYYLIQWKGYQLHDATWEPKENLNHCEDILKEFHETRTFHF